MTVGCPKEIKVQENRVALTPAGAGQLVRRGVPVLVQRDAGAGADYLDSEYVEAGAEIVESAEQIFERADLIVKVKEPQPTELAMLRPEHVLFTYLHLAADKKLTEALIATGATSIAYETVQIGDRLPLLEPMSEVAGRMSVIVGAYFLAEHSGGRGTLLGGVPGVLPGRVVILGGGTCGLNAARVATGIGAETTILELDSERMSWLDTAMPAARTLYSSEAALVDLLPRTDLLIGAVLLPGAKAPKLVDREMLGLMRNGTVLVDISVDQGGCIETTRPTTHEDPIFVEEGVIHYCVANMPGAYARTSTQALTSVTLPYLQALALEGVDGACARHPELVGGINTLGGRLTCEEVGEAHGLDWTSAHAGRERRVSGERRQS
ncbi:MAG: alanine dehydrogenase [Deltaproteobacteria bacterium]|jgi:alanine dehydrogenase|nr:alanine dehydrogenase [Deltaproteobacteria bacterium]